MSPPISKDLWLAAALTGAALPAALAQPADVDRQKTAVVTSVTTSASRTANVTTKYIDATSGQRLITDANTTMHVLFSDQSSITLGPNSEMVIAKYQFDSKAKTGQLLMDMTKGLLRVVGGLISKKTETVVRTNTATVGIRGGITVVEVTDLQTQAAFLFGEQMRVTGNNGQTQTVSRPGFGVTSSNQGVSDPDRFLTDVLSQWLADVNIPNTNLVIPDDGPDISRFDPERVNPPGTKVEEGFVAPTLNDILGAQSPGNQS